MASTPWVRETEAAPRRCYSSSSTRSFDRIFDLCVHGDIDGVLYKKALSLSKLTSPTENGYTLNPRVLASEKDIVVGKYVKGLIPPGLSNVEVSVDKDLDAFQHLRPFLKSVQNQPDVVFLKGGLPFLIVEVQSSSFENSLCKTVVGLIDQLRLLRNYSQDITECTGFTFPNFKCKECVAKVHVQWKDLAFHIQYTPLTSADDVSTEVHQAITHSLHLSNRIREGVDCDCFFIPLSSADLQSVSKGVQEEIQCQLHSRQSIILKGTNYVWKYNPNDGERCAVWSYLKHIAIGGQYAERKVNSLDFIGCEIYECPLSKQEAKCCLLSLVKGIIRALNHHHNDENVAHLDVQLDNICFKLPDTVVMIDFDRLKEAKRPASVTRIYGNSVMYQKESGWVCENLDWKQLGIMIVWVIGETPVGDYHQMDLTSVTDPFLKCLLFQGKCDTSKFPGILLNYDSKTLEDVLGQRHV